jgi:hypothetical protein
LVEFGADFRWERNEVAGQLGTVVAEEQELNVIRAAEPLQDIVPIAARTLAQFFTDHFGHGLQPISRSARQQGVQAQAQLHFDDEIKGKGQHHQVQEEPK